MAEIGENIRVLRLSRGWTQQELAAQLHMTRQAVGHYESGRTVPDVETCRRLAEVFGVELEVLLEGEGGPVQLPRWLWWLTTLALLVPLLLHSLLLTAARFYAVPEGQVTQEQMQLLQTRFALTGAAETVESLGYMVFLLALIVLVLWELRQRTALPWRDKGRLFVSLLLLSLPVTLPFALGDPAAGLWNYLFPAVHNGVRLLMALVLGWLIHKVQKR